MHQSATVRSLCLFLVTFSLVLLLACDDDRHLEPNPDAPEFSEAAWPSDDTDIVTTSLTLSWLAMDPNGDGLFYDLYVSTQWPLRPAVTEIGQSSFTLTDLERGKTYFWKVVARDPDGNTGESGVHTFHVLEPSAEGYPLRVGNQWLYEYRRYYADIQLNPDVDPNSPELEHFRDTLYGSSLTTVTGLYELENVGATYALREEALIDGYPYVGGHYFGNFDEGLYAIGYWGDVGYSGALPRSPSLLDNDQPNIPFLSLWRPLGATDPLSASQDVDSVFWETPPLKSLQYPLEPGNEWVFLYVGGMPGLFIEKEVVDEADIHVPAGEFDCSVVRWWYRPTGEPDLTTSSGMFDYIAEEGLIKRHHFAIVVMTSYGSPSGGLGTATMHIEYVLKDLSEGQIRWPEPE